MNNLIIYTEIEYRPHNWDLSPATMQKTVNGQLSNTKSRAQENKSEDDQICLTRLMDREAETIPTGSTKEMVEKLIQEIATENEKETVKKMLESALNRNLSRFSKKKLGIIGKLLELSGNIAFISKLLASDQIGSKLDALENALQDASALLLNKKITTEFLGKILMSRLPERTINLLNKHPELLNNEKLTPELWNLILKYTCPYDVLTLLVENPELLDNEQLTFQLWGKLLATRFQGLTRKALYSSYIFQILPELLKKITTELLTKILSLKNLDNALKNLIKLLKYEQTTTELLAQILTLSDPSQVLRDLAKYSELLKNKNITTELLSKMLEYNYFTSFLRQLAESPELLKSKKISTELLDQTLSSGTYYSVFKVLVEYQLLKNEKITTELLSQVLLLSDPISVLKALAEHPSLVEHPELLKNEILTPKLLEEMLSIRILDQILSSQDPLGVVILLRKYPELLNNKKIMPKVWDQILGSSDPVYVLNEALKGQEKHTELLHNKVWRALASLLKLPSPFVDELLASKDPGGILDALRVGTQLLNNFKLTPKFLEKIASLHDPSGILRSLDKCLLKYPDLHILDLPADKFVQLAEKLIFLVLRGDSRVNDIIAQINKNISIQEIEIQINKIITSVINCAIKDINALKEISNPIFFQLERSKKVAQLFVNEAGELNLFLIDELKKRMPTSVSPAHDKEFNGTLDNLKNNRELSSTLTSINIPADPSNKANLFIRATLQLGVDTPLSVQQVRQAALSALLMDLRQSQTGSCFVTSVAIRIHSMAQERFLQDMKDMIENGYMKRSLNGKKSELFWSIIPTEESGFNDPIHKENMLAALQALDFTLFEAQEIYKAYIEKCENSLQYFSELIEELVSKKLGISQKAIDERREFEKIVKPDEKAISILSSRVKIIDTKFDAFDKLVAYAEVCFTSASHNLLLRGWEYGLGAAGKFELGFEGKNIYKSLWGESASTRKHYGIDTALRYLTTEILKTDERLSEEQISNFTYKLSDAFRPRFDQLFINKVKHQYQYGGVTLYEKTNSASLNEVQMISPLSNPIEFQDLVGKFVLETGFELRKDVERFERQDFELIFQIVTRLSQYVRSHDFLEHFIRSISCEIDENNTRIQPSDKIPEIPELKNRFKKLIDGGQPDSLLKIYYESPDIKPINFIAKNAEDLLVHLITELRKLKIDKEQKIFLPLAQDIHAFLLMPNHPSFRRALDSDLSAKDWVNQHVKEQNETIVFADSNWEVDGVHRMFAICKNKKGAIIISTCDEIGQVISGGIDSFGMKQDKMDQTAWVNNREFKLYTDLP